MNIFIPFIYLFVLGGGLATVTRRRFSEIIPTTIMITALVTYTLGYSNLRIGYYGCIILFAISLFIVVVRFLKGKLSENMKVYGEGAIILFLIYIFIIIWNKNRSIVFGGDEYSHWAFMIKEMFRINKFYIYPGSLLVAHRDYPPLIPLLQTLFCEVLGKYKEEYSYMALQLASFAMLIPFLPQVKTDWKRSKKVLYILMQVLILIVICSTIQIAEAGFFKTLYVDCFVAILFVYGVLFVISERKITAFSIFNCSIYFCFLLLSKQVNEFFAIIILAILLYRVGIQEYVNKKSVVVKKLVLTACYILIPALIYQLSWNHLINNYQTYQQFTIKKISSTKDVIFGLLGMGTGLQKTVLVRFAEALFATPILSIGINLSYIQYLLIIIAILIGIWYFTKNKKDVMQLGVILVGTAILYAGMMLGTYLFLFSESEALDLACFERYMLTYVYASVLIIILYVLMHFEYHYIEIKMFCIIFVCGLLINPETFDNWLLPGFEYERFANKYDDDIEIIEDTTPDNASIYLIAQGDVAGETRNVLMYEATPRRFQTYNFSLGDSKFEGDYRTVKLTPSELEKEMQGYNYLYINQADGDIAKYYGEFFENPTDIANRQMYYIERINNKISKFVKLK